MPQVSILVPIILGVVLAAAAAACWIISGQSAAKKAHDQGFAEGEEHRKLTSEKTIGSAEEHAKSILADANKQAESKKREALIEAKDEIHRQRVEADKELRDRRAEVQRQERRIQQREETLDKRSDNLEKKEEILQSKVHAAEKAIDEAERLKEEQLDKLRIISGYTQEQAKQVLLEQLDHELTHEKAIRILDVKQKTEDESDTIAKEIIATAIQRCAADHSAEITVSVVPLPSDEMKGRIIGREGRNIRTLETITGVDLIIDDTPEAITVSCFDPVRREIARQTIEKLVIDGRIHPARVEEIFAKCTRDMEITLKQAGERALIDAGVNNVHGEMVKLLGKLQYRTSYGQNVLNHSLEVSYIAGLMAAEIGADVKLAKRAGLLHDIGKAIDHEQEGSHVELGLEYARKYKENDQVLHAIQAHHGDVEPKTLVAMIVQAADAVSAGRPGARRENMESYIKRLEKLEEVVKSFEGVESTFAMQAGREIRVMVKPEAISDDAMVLLAREIAQKIETDLEYPGQIKVNLIRESRVSDIAK
ncbi:MAG: ribonuclease Y [Oscillospiraceae bacterium]|jgi:ribonuclease Y|nr:ribonuclease Y [Oscillospiraceae bacterium]